MLCVNAFLIFLSFYFTSPQIPVHYNRQTVLSSIMALTIAMFFWFHLNKSSSVFSAAKITVKLMSQLDSLYLSFCCIFFTAH